MVHVREAVHAGKGVVIHPADDAVHHPGSAGGRGNFSWIEHIEAEGVVGLVPGTVSDRGALLEAQFRGCRAGQGALLKSQKMPSDRPLTVVQVTPVSRMAM